MFSETWTVGARIDVPRDQGGLLMPGDHGTVHVTLTMPMAMTVDQHFTVRICACALLFTQLLILPSDQLTC